MLLKKICQIWIAIAVMSVGLAFGQVSISRGFMQRNDYLAMSKMEKFAYVMGLADSALASPLLGAPQEKIHWFKSCLKDITNERLVSYLDEYLLNDVESGRVSVNVSFFNAVRKRC